MVNFKQMIAVAAIGFMSASANAAVTTTSLETLSNDAGAFSLTSSFTIGAGFTGVLDGYISSIYRSLVTIRSGIDLTGVTLSSGVLSSAETTNTIALKGAATQTTDTFSFGTGALSAGTYTLTFMGTAYGAKALSKTAGSYTVTTTPVPEPEYFSMMGLGLALVGLMARRRQA